MGNSRAFAVWFEKLQAWNPSGYVVTGWQWPSEFIKPLSIALRRKQVEVDRQLYPFDALRLVTLHFDGTIEPRDLQGKDDFKGKLFFADINDVIYSKIDVRNGAIGIVPHELGRAAVSSEYPVYQVQPSVASAEYIQLLFRTNEFRKKINSMISGASGRKRVQPEQLESLDIPLPPLDVQRAIVAHWQTAQAEAAALDEQAKQTETDSERRFAEALGLKTSMGRLNSRMLVLEWKDSILWSVRVVKMLTQGNDLSESSYSIINAANCIDEIRHGCGASPSLQPTGLEILKISAATRGYFDDSARKHITNTPRFRREFDLRAGDVLMCRTNGTLAYVGIPALVEKDMPDLIFPDKLIRVRTKGNVDPAYFWTVTKLPQIRAQIEAAARTAVGNYAIGTDDIRNLRFPFPPLNVQRELVAYMQSARAEATRLRAEATQRLATAKVDLEAMILGTRSVGGSLAACKM